MKDNKRLYRLIDYPKKGNEYGNFKASYPYLAAHKIVNFLKVTDENKHNMAKFWIREYVPVPDLFIDFILFIKKKLLSLNNLEINNILLLLYINIIYDSKLLKKNKLNNINIEKHIKSFNRLKKNELINLVALLLINYYKLNKLNKLNKTNIFKLLNTNLSKLNNNIDQTKNLSNIIINNHHKVKIPKIFNHLLINIYITHEDKNNTNIILNKQKRMRHFKRLHKNLKFC